MEHDILNKSSIDYDYRINPGDSPSSNSIESNETVTPLLTGEIGMVKTVDKEYATIGDVLTYTITLSNLGNVLLTDITFKDVIPNGVTFVPSSVTVDSVSEPTFDPNTGFDLGSLAILGSKTVSFQVEVVSLPEPNTITNQATTDFTYLVVLIPTQGSSESNEVTTIINVTGLTLVKSADKEEVTRGDTLTYTTVITNIGNIDAESVEFTDILSSDVTFITGSVLINSVSEPTYDPNVGFDLGTIEPDEVITVVFSVNVN